MTACVRLGDHRSGKAVYAFNFPSRPELLKIGYTTRNPEKRIAEQATGWPEQPQLRLTYFGDDAASVEEWLHRRLAPHRVPNAGGVEWFRVTVDDVVEEITRRTDRVVDLRRNRAKYDAELAQWEREVEGLAETHSPEEVEWKRRRYEASTRAPRIEGGRHSVLAGILAFGAVTAFCWATIESMALALVFLVLCTLAEWAHDRKKARARTQHEEFMKAWEEANPRPVRTDAHLG